MDTYRLVAAVFAVGMLTSLCLVALGFASVAEDSWTQRALMHVPRAYLGVAAVGEKIYAIGGDEGSLTGNCMTADGITYNVVNSTEEYDPSSDQWVLKAPMPTARARFGTAVYQGKIYCIGGYNGATVFVGPENWNWKTEYYDLSVNEVYDPATDTWETKAPLPNPRSAAATSTVDGKIYVIGGHTMKNLSTILSVNEVYDPATNTWATRASAPLKVENSASAVVDGKIYVLGASSNSPWQLSIQVYDPANDSWTVRAASPVAYSATAAATTGVNAPKRIYFFDENRTDIYDPVSDNWATGIPSAPRPIAGAATLKDMIYVIGGRTGQWGYMTFMYPSALNEQYTPIGYGTQEPTYQTSTPAPTPSFSPIPAPSPTPTIKPTPSQTPCPTPTSSPIQMPTAESTQTAQSTPYVHNSNASNFLIIGIVAITAAIAVIMLVGAVWKKRK